MSLSAASATVIPIYLRVLLCLYPQLLLLLYIIVLCASDASPRPMNDPSQARSSACAFRIHSYR